MTELERLRDRVAELEEAMGLTAMPPSAIPRELVAGTRARPMIAKFIGILLKREIGDRGAIFSALYGSLPEADHPDEKTLDVYACAARKVLRSHGVEMKTIYGRGWQIDAANKAKLRAIIAKINQQQAA